MITKKFFSRSTLLILITLLSACAVIAPPNTPTPTATATPTSTPTATPTATPTPKPTTTPTGEPQDETWLKLKNDGYKVVTSASTLVSDKTYFAYLLALTSLNNNPLQYCAISFYYWSGYEYNLIQNTQTTGECKVIPWGSIEEQVALKREGYWSDINNNGFPEFAIQYYNGCLSGQSYDCLFFWFYEIRDEKTVVNLSDTISDKIIPGHIFYKNDPLTIYALSTVEYDHIWRSRFEIFWLYEWDGKKFINVSSKYPDEFRLQAQKVVKEIEKEYGKTFPLNDNLATRMTNILAIYNDTELPRGEGLKIFLDITDPSHWPNSDQPNLCWLQAARAYAQIDFEQNKPFRIFLIFPSFVNNKYTFPTDIDPRFDTSACK